jgi:hypothetical protein
MHKKYMPSLMPSNELLINAIDEEEENHGSLRYHEKTTTFPLQLILKLNMLFEIYSYNYDSQNGLGNGVDGIIKAYAKTHKGYFLWIKFYDIHIGHQQAIRLYSLYSIEMSSESIPILHIAKPISTNSKTFNLKIPPKKSNSTCVCMYNTQIIGCDVQKCCI